MKKLKGYLEQKKDGEIVGVASTEAIDRDGESIRQDGWNLANFKKNPVILVGHNYQEFPVGKATDIAIDNGKLLFKAVFSNKTKKAREAYELVKEGILAAFSVGFIPREYQKDNASVITKAELLEISLVPVPANPEAIVLAKGFQEKNEIAQYIVRNFFVEKKEETPEKPEEAQEKEEPPVQPEITSADEELIEGGKEGDTASEIDLKLLQATVGHLQILCRELKKKGGAK